jgi:uncharacterized protein YhfF
MRAGPDRMGRRTRLTFWGASEDDDSLPRAVMEGRKTVTADTVEDYYKPYGEFGDGSYEAGDVIEVYDLKQRLRCLIRATRVQRIRFGDVPEAVWRGEGAGRRGSALNPASRLAFKLAKKLRSYQQEFDKANPNG